MKIALLAVTKRGKALAETIQPSLAGSELVATSSGIRRSLEMCWAKYDGIVCIMATGIVVRCLSGLCRSKQSDPAVVVLDEAGRHAISLLSGHLGGANRLAERLADICGGTAVITTASDVSGHTSVDLWTIEEQLSIVNPGGLTAISARLLNSGSLSLYQDSNYVENLPGDFTACPDPQGADIIISLQDHSTSRNSLHLVPRIHYIGFGCRRGVRSEDFTQMLAQLQESHGLNLASVAAVASIDLKHDEAGLLTIAAQHGWPVRFFGKDELNAAGMPAASAKVYEKTGAWAVCEPAAVLAATRGDRPGRLVIGKVIWKNITAAVARRAD